MISRLKFSTELCYGKTNISDVYFTPPYKIMSPFFEGRHSDIMIMSASAGLLGGDEVYYDIKFGENTDTTILSQSYEKILNSDGKQVKKNINLTIEDNAKVKYMPYPVIPFEGSDYTCEGEAHVASSSEFLYCDIFSCGRAGMGELFQMKKYRSRFHVFIDDELVFADHTLLNPQMFHYENIGMWESYTHSGMMYIYTPDAEDELNILKKIRELHQEEKLYFGATILKRGILVRILSNTGDDIWNFFNRISGYV